jgi:CheY-like chemotaxis protein
MEVFIGNAGGVMDGRKVLVVDDEDIVRISCKRVLETEGCDVVLASCGGEAIERLEQGGVGFAFIDLIMPGMDGFELLRRIKEKWPLVRTAVITGFGTQDSIDRARELGAGHFLKKPFLPEDLVRVIGGDAVSYNTAPDYKA